MLRGILYDTISSDAAGATVRLLPDSPVYKGHFPGYPITPGVCLVQIALELISEREGRPVRLVASKNIKFTSPVFPGKGSLLRFDLSGSGSDWSVDVSYGDVPSARMTLTLE